MKVTVELVTPQRASQLLGGNVRNRKLRQSLVEHYAQEMRQGRWLQTHQGIAVNCDGTLLDGQHRLAAIVKCGIPQMMVVATGVNSESQIAMDDHAKRTAADAISLARGTEISKDIVAIGRTMARFSCGDNRSVSKQELTEILDTISPAIEFIKPFVASKERGVSAAPVWASVVLAWFYVNDLDRLFQFCSVLRSMQQPDYETDKAAIVLREWLLKSGSSTSGLQREAFKKTQRAIVAFMKRQAIGKLYGTDIFYPWPLNEPLRVK